MKKAIYASRTDGSKTKKPYYLKSITKNLLTTLNPTDSYLTKIKHPKIRKQSQWQSQLQ